jgi:hypothetical protein
MDTGQSNTYTKGEQERLETAEYNMLDSYDGGPQAPLGEVVEGLTN